MSYLAHTYRPGLRIALEKLEQCTADILDQFDHVLVTGLSGVIPGAIFCDRFNKWLVVVRKGESTHGSHIEGPYDWDKKREPGDRTGAYIIIDDFIASGNTIDRLLNAHMHKRLPEYVILYLRDQCLRYDTPTFRLDATGVPGRYTVQRKDQSC